MPYKIVQTIEDNKIRLTAVPGQWEDGGILRYPSKKIEKQRKNEDSIPKQSWVSMTCLVKRVNLTYKEAETEILKMCNTSDTETDFEEHSSRKKKKSVTIESEDTPDVNNFNELANECINNELSYSVDNVENQIMYISQDAGSAETVQFSIPEIPIKNTPVNTKYNYLSTACTLESKLDCIAEKVNLLSENIIVVQANQQELYKTQRDILLSLANINVQFEELIKKVHIQSEVKKSDNGFKRISDQESFDNLEKMLEDTHFANGLLKKMSAVCGTQRGKGINNAYALIDVMFDRQFLQQCSWAGGSRSNSAKICFKSRTNILNFFFTIINKSDENFTLLDTQQFFKVILRNSRQRYESKQERTSVTKAKKQNHERTKVAQLPPEDIVNQILFKPPAKVEEIVQPGPSQYVDVVYD